MKNLKNSNLTILMVDDDVDLRMLTAQILEGEGYQVTTAGSGKECLDLARTNKPDILLLDLMLPDVYGADVCRFLKTDPATSHIYIILISGLKTQSELISEGLEAGADSFLIKPLKNREFVACIRAARRTIEAEQSLRRLQERTSAIMSAIPDIIVEVDQHKVYTWSNPAGYDFFGQDVVGKSASFYFEGAQNTHREVEPLFQGNEEVLYVESWQRRRDGEKRLLAWWCRVLKDENGEVTGAISAARDITRDYSLRK